MAKKKFIYNPETCSYEPVVKSKRAKLGNFIGLFTLSLLAAAGITYVYHTHFTPVKESRLINKNQELVSQFQTQYKKLENAKFELATLQERDDHIFRTLLDLETIDPLIREAGVGGTNKYEEIENSSLERKNLVLSLMEGVDQLKGQIYIQTRSYDELEDVLVQKKIMWASRPAITPMSMKDVHRIGSGFGWRHHPIRRVLKFHNGVDIGASTGKPIYASGDGVVTRANYGNGYGNVVYIDHGFGYETRYAHMSAFNVKLGDRVKRGDVIGFVGNTGLSTAPHLHYEVLLHGKFVDPVAYLSKNLNSEEFQKLIDDSNSSEDMFDY